MLGLRSIISRLMIRPQIFYQPFQCVHVSEVDFRARKGTREKWEKLKKKNKQAKLAKLTKITKTGFIPRSKLRLSKVDKHLINLDEGKLIPTDDAFPGRYYRWPMFTAAQAINNHKEYCDPTMWDSLDSMLNVSIEMNMIGEKPTRMVSNFQKLVLLKHPFEHGQERQLLVFAKEEVHRSKAIEAGAAKVGGSDLIKSALKGNIRFADYEFILAHPDIMPEMLALRGLLKKKFPNAKNETLGLNLHEMVSKFMRGIFIHGLRDENQQDFGVVNTPVGTLKMSTEELVANFRDMMIAVNKQRPNRGGKFITRVHFTTTNSTEIFKIDPIDFPFEDYDRAGKVVTLAKNITKKSKKTSDQMERTYTLFRTPV